MAKRSAHRHRSITVDRHHGPVQQPVEAHPRTLRCAGVGRRDVLGAPALRELLVQGSTVDLQDVRPGDTGPRERPNHLRGKELAGPLIGREVALQLHAHAAVSASHVHPAAVDTGQRAAQPQTAQVVAHRPHQLRARAGQQLVHELGGQQIGIVDRHIARVGHDRATRRVGEVHRVPAIGGLKLTPVKEYPVGQRIDPPFAIGLHQRELGILNITLVHLENPDVGQRAQLVGAHIDRPPVDAALVGE